MGGSDSIATVACEPPVKARALTANALDITVLIATHNRARVLDQTLGYLERVDRGGIRAEFVIIDNNSTDDTRAVVEKHKPNLPLRYLFEGRPGKNHALNKALDEVALGELAAFTDDDVNPDPGWLNAMIDAARRHPDIAVFGGAIRVDLPACAPDWAHSPMVQKTTYALHRPSEIEATYAQVRGFPCGANLWMRREIFAGGLRFDATVGPRPQRRFMGSETALLRRLIAEGHEILHVPTAVVGHCIQHDALTPTYVRQRAWRRGKSKPHAVGAVAQADLRARHRLTWTCARIGAVVYWAGRYLLARLSPSRTRRIEKSIGPLVGLAAEWESLRLAGRSADAMRELRKLPA